MLTAGRKLLEATSRAFLIEKRDFSLTTSTTSCWKWPQITLHVLRQILTTTRLRKWYMLLREYRIKNWFSFPPHQINVLHCLAKQTSTEIAPFRSNFVLPFCQKTQNTESCIRFCCDCSRTVAIKRICYCPPRCPHRRTDSEYAECYCCLDNNCFTERKPSLSAKR